MSPHEPKTGPTTRPRSPAHADDHPEPRLGLSASQLVASALAAASAAFGASFLGVAGTIIGAAVASVIATVASAMYTSSLQRSTEAMRRTATQWTRTTATAPVVDPSAPEPRAPRRPLPWTRISVAAAAVLALTLGALTGVEGLLGKPLAGLLGGSDATGTSLGSVGGGPAAETGQDGPATPSRSPSPDPTPTTTGTPTTGPTVQPTAPATTPTPSPTTSPTAGPTTAPTTSPPAGG
jgi:hypothetical protein